MKEITIDVWAIVSELIERVPGLLINREAFLRDVFRDKLSPDQLNRVVELGDYGDVRWICSTRRRILASTKRA